MVSLWAVTGNAVFPGPEFRAFYWGSEMVCPLANNQVKPGSKLLSQQPVEGLGVGLGRVRVLIIPLLAIFNILILFTRRIT
jgi:hypothetical protein